MPVNTSQAAVAAKTAIIDVGVVGIGGYFMGMPIEAMILGAMAGALANGLNPPEKRRNVALAILVSMVLAGTFAPVLELWLADWVNLSNAQREIEALRVAAPVVVGGGWSWIAPLLASSLRQKWDGFLNKLAEIIVSKGSGDKS